MVNTKLWSDNYIRNLNPKEKLLFVYLMTNMFTNLCGIYEIDLRQVELDTALSSEDIKSILQKFYMDKKAIYIDGYIGIKNYQKHQNTNSSKIQKGIELSLEEIPVGIKNKMLEFYGQEVNNVPVPVPVQSEAVQVIELDTETMRVIEIWNTLADRCNLAKVQAFTDKRKSAVKQRLKEKQFDLLKICEKIVKSDFLLGKNKENWKVTFDFVFLSKNNYVKILEGNYDNKKPLNSNANSMNQIIENAKTAMGAFSE